MLAFRMMVASQAARFVPGEYDCQDRNARR